MLGAKDCSDSCTLPLPFRPWRQWARAILTPGRRALLAALKSHLVICWGDVSLTANQSEWCICQVGGVCLRSAQLTGLIVLSLLLSSPICLQSRALPVCLSLGCPACTHCLLSFPRKPSHGCRAAPKAKLEAKPASSPLLSHPSLAQITQFQMMVFQGNSAKGASLDDLINGCIQCFGELANCPHAENSLY